MSKTLVINGANFSTNKVATIEFDRIHTTAFSIDESSAIELTSIGATHQIEYTIIPSNSEDPVLWISSNTSVCTVDENGIVTAVGCGTATITGTSNSISDTCSVECAIELTGFIRAPKTYLAGENNNDHSGQMDTYIGISNTGYDQYMVMIATDSAKERLNSHFKFAGLNEQTNKYELKSDYTTGSSGRVYQNIGYVVPIMLPNNCQKVTCIAPSDKYAPCLTFFKSEVRAAESDSNQKYFSAYKEAKVLPNSYSWQYAASTDVNVISGYDSFAVIWKANIDGGATSFAEMTESQLAEFKIICT